MASVLAGFAAHHMVVNPDLDSSGINLRHFPLHRLGRDWTRAWNVAQQVGPNSVSSDWEEASDRLRTRLKSCTDQIQDWQAWLANMG